MAAGFGKDASTKYHPRRCGLVQHTNWLRDQKVPGSSPGCATSLGLWEGSLHAFPHANPV